MPIRTGTSASDNLTTALGGTPAVGYDAIIEGEQHYINGLDISTNEGNSIWIKDDARVGGNGSSMTCDLATSGDVLHMESSQACYVGAGGSGATIDKVLCTHAPRGLYLTAGTVATLHQADGVTDFNTAVDLQAAIVTGGSVHVNTHASPSLDTFHMYGNAQAIIKRSIGTGCTVGAGTRLVTDEYTMTIASISVYGSWQVNNGTVTSAVFYPGSVIDLSKLDGDMTFSALTVYPGVSFVPPPTGVTVTWPTPTLVAGGTYGPWS